MLDATPRGDHLACLVSRLRHISPRLQVIASSATIDDPTGLSRRYLGDDSQIVQATGDRPIEAEITSSSAGALADALIAMTRSGEVRKVLVFVQRRADAERFFSVFRGRPPFGDAVFLHHGSLSRTRRETVERRMLTGTSGLCFATTTLEVGIDIGDIDLIVLASPPADVASLLQRIGRGSRRRPVTRVCCLAADPGEALRYEHLLLCAREGRLLGGPYQFCPSVLVQQCMSLLMQTPRKNITARAFASRIPPWLGETEWTSRLPELLNRLLERGWLIGGSTRYSMGEKLDEAFERGRMHSNIDSGNDAVEVVDQDTRQVLGTLPRVAAGESGLLLGGRRLKVSRRKSPSQILVTDSADRTDLTVPNRRGSRHSCRTGKGPGAVCGDRAPCGPCHPARGRTFCPVSLYGEPVGGPPRRAHGKTHRHGADRRQCLLHAGGQSPRDLSAPSDRRGDSVHGHATPAQAAPQHFRRGMGRGIAPGLASHPSHGLPRYRGISEGPQGNGPHVRFHPATTT